MTEDSLTTSKIKDKKTGVAKEALLNAVKEKKHS
jgi:hypothetical protein